MGEAGVAGDAARSRYGPQCMACAASLGIAGVFPGGYGCDVRGIRLLDEPFGRRRAVGAVQRLFAAHYGDEVMANRFQTMSMYPCLAGFRG